MVCVLFYKSTAEYCATGEDGMEGIVGCNEKLARGSLCCGLWIPRANIRYEAAISAKGAIRINGGINSVEITLKQLLNLRW